MGPNGSGKSTLSYVIAGKEDYEVLDGEILLNGENMLEMEADARAAAGLFLAFQYPLEIPGVATMTFLKAAMNAQRKFARRGRAVSRPPSSRRVNGARRAARHPQGHAEARAQRRLLRRREEAHGDPADGAAAAEDVHPRRDRFRPRHRRAADRLRTASTGCAAAERSFLVITHYQRLLDHIVPGHRACDAAKGRIVKSGGKDLALELEKNGYRDYSEAA